MSLAEKLGEISAASAKRMPEDVRAIMGRATQELRESGILDRCIQVGDKLPPFNLENANGEMVSSADLLSKGAVVITVFRGHW